MYQVEDFSEYKRFFERDNVKVFKFLQPLEKLKIQEFVQQLNTVIEQPIYVVNYTEIILYLSKIGKSRFIKEITDSIKFPNYKVLYLYFKFLLLEPNQKNKIFNEYISVIPHFRSILKICSWQEMIECIFKYMNDECLEDFMDCFDTNNEYIPLNTQEMSFIEFNKEQYLTIDFYFIFYKFVLSVQKLNLLYTLNYCVSNMPTYKSMAEYEGQLLSGMEDFSRRFNYNIDKYAMLYNYLNHQYSYKYKRIQDMYPNDINSYVEIIRKMSCENKVIGIDAEITKQDKEYCTREIIYYLLDTEWVYGKYFDTSDIVLNIYLEKVIEYKKFFPSDDYKLLQLVKKDPFDSSKKLKNLFEYTFHVFDSLLHISRNVFKKLLQIESYNEILNKELLNQDEIELKKYLENLFTNYYYLTEWHHYITGQEKIRLDYL